MSAKSAKEDVKKQTKKAAAVKDTKPVAKATAKKAEKPSAAKPAKTAAKPAAKATSAKKETAKPAAKATAAKPATKATAEKIKSATKATKSAVKETPAKTTAAKKETAKAKAPAKSEKAEKPAVKAAKKPAETKQTSKSAAKPVKEKTPKTSKAEKVDTAKKGDAEEDVTSDDPFFLMRLDEVVKSGKKKGFLEIAELNDAFDSMNPGEELYEKIYATLDKNGIILRDENVSVEADGVPSDDFFKDSEEEMSEEDAEIIAEVEEQGESDDLSDDYLDTTDPVKVYLKEIGRVPLLTADREIEFAKMMEDGHAAKAENDELMGQLVELEEKQAARPTQKVQKEIDKITAQMAENKKPIDAGKRAAKRLAEANLRLVVSIAKRYVGRGMQLLDLVQEGNMGLIKAVEKFDYRRGFKFSTYATWWIRQAITRAIADQARTIRIPVHMVETINKIVRINRQLVQELGREPSTAEIAERMGMTEDRVREIQRISQEPTSLETPIGEEEDSHLGDFLADNDTPTPEQVAKSVMLRKQIDKALDTLTERERKVLVLRFGLEDGRARTLEEVGKVFEVTRERIRQIEAKALRRLRHPKQRKLFEGFMS